MVRKFNLQSVCLLLFLLSYNFCFSQSDKFSLGIKAGISIPNLKASGDNPVSKGWASRLGPYAGAIAGLKFSERFSLQAELNYSSQGGKKNGKQAIATSGFAEYIPPGTTVPPYVYANYNDEVKLNYIELPVLAKFNFTINNVASFFINAGLYGGYLVNAQNVTSGSSNIYFDENLTHPFLPSAISFDQTSDIKSDLKKINYGIQGGFGFDFKISDKSKIMTTAGGNYGLVKIQKDKSNGENNTGAATVTLGYIIQL